MSTHSKRASARKPAPDATLNPGSREARLQGCTCPVWDNARGKGYAITEQGPIFVMSAGCPLHGLPSEQDSEKENGSIAVEPSQQSFPR